MAIPIIVNICSDMWGAML